MTPLKTSSFTITWRGHKKSVSFQEGITTISELSRAISQLLCIPIEEQKLLLPKGKLIKPSASQDIVLDGFYNGIRIRLLGSTDTETRTLATHLMELQREPDMATLANQAYWRGFAKWTQCTQIIGTGPPPVPLELEDIAEGYETIEGVEANRRRFGPLAAGLGTTTYHRMTAMMGIGIIPRLNCTHIPNASHYLGTGCHACKCEWIADWNHFVLREAAFRCYLIATLSPAPPAGTTHVEMRSEAVVHPQLQQKIREDQATYQESNQLIHDLEKEWLAGKTELLGDEINHLLWAMDAESCWADGDNELTDKVALDFQSFENVLKLLWDEGWKFEEKVGDVPTPEPAPLQIPARDFQYGSMAIRTV